MRNNIRVSELYALRFNKELSRRQAIWKILCENFFQKYVSESDALLDLGAGYCEFINNIRSGKKYAVDINRDLIKYCPKNVTPLVTVSTNLPNKLRSKIDVVFVSNFFEHLPTKEDLIKTILEIRKVLRKGGKLIILMPNLRYVGAAYWDFLDHQLPLTEKSMVEALELNGFEIMETKSKFLPYTTKGKMPKLDIFVKVYLKIPLLHMIFGKQSLLVAKKLK